MSFVFDQSSAPPDSTGNASSPGGSASTPKAGILLAPGAFSNPTTPSHSRTSLRAMPPVAAPVGLQVRNSPLAKPDTPNTSPASDSSSKPPAWPARGGSDSSIMTVVPEDNVSRFFKVMFHPIFILAMMSSILMEWIAGVLPCTTFSWMLFIVYHGCFIEHLYQEIDKNWAKRKWSIVMFRSSFSAIIHNPFLWTLACMLIFAIPRDLKEICFAILFVLIAAGVLYTIKYKEMLSFPLFLVYIIFLATNRNMDVHYINAVPWTINKDTFYVDPNYEPSIPIWWIMSTVLYVIVQNIQAIEQKYLRKLIISLGRTENIYETLFDFRNTINAIKKYTCFLFPKTLYQAIIYITVALIINAFIIRADCIWVNAMTIVATWYIRMLSTKIYNMWNYGPIPRNEIPVIVTASISFLKEINNKASNSDTEMSEGEYKVLHVMKKARPYISTSAQI